MGMIGFKWAIQAIRIIHNHSAQKQIRDKARIRRNKHLPERTNRQKVQFLQSVNYVAAEVEKTCLIR